MTRPPPVGDWPALAASAAASAAGGPGPEADRIARRVLEHFAAVACVPDPGAAMVRELTRIRGELAERYASKRRDDWFGRVRGGELRAMLALARAIRDAGAPAMTAAGFAHLAPTLRRGAVSAPFVLEAASRHAADRLGSAGWHRLVHFALVASSTRKLTGAGEPGRLRFASLDELCTAAGLDPHRTADARELLALGSALRFDFAGSPAQAWAVHVAPGRPNRVDWQIMPWVYDPHADHLASRLLLFVPATPAPTVGGERARSAGEQWALFWRWLAWLPERADELRDAGTLTLPRATWATLADDAGWSAKLRRERLDELRDKYLAAGFLGLAERDRYTPGPALLDVAEAVKVQANLRDAGRRGGRKRRKRRKKPQ